MYDPLKHNCYKKLLKLFNEDKLPRSCLSGVDIYHDDWCRIYRGGYCNCDPDIVVRPPAEWN
jgi:hypothetical protein